MPLPNGRRSEGDAQRSTKLKFCIAFTVIITVWALLFYANLFDTYFADYYHRAAGIWKGLSVMFFAGSIFCLWSTETTWGEKAGYMYFGLVLIFLVLATCAASGWDFSLFGITSR